MCVGSRMITYITNYQIQLTVTALKLTVITLSGKNTKPLHQIPFAPSYSKIIQVCHTYVNTSVSSSTSVLILTTVLKTHLQDKKPQIAGSLEYRVFHNKLCSWKTEAIVE